MCGVFGAINLNAYFGDGDYEKFAKLNDMTYYRGPDASGDLAINLKKQSVANKKEFDVFLGHRRLSIIDLSEEANQPLTDGKGAWIIYNGEIFNYVELRKELIEKGHIFKTKSDTEVILKIYDEYGDSGFAKLNGMWAFVVVDVRNKRVILSRDRFSIKPLYLTKMQNKIYFASEIKQLLPLVDKKEINNDVMFTYLNQGLIDYSEKTFYRYIDKVKPKTSLVIQMDTGEIKEKQYWDYYQEEITSIKDAEEKFRDLFIDSVKIRLRSDVKLAGLLSGGLDSSAIAVIANRIQGGNFETYSVISNDERYSEEKFIDIVSGDKGIDNYKLCCESDEIMGSLLDVIYHNDEPFGGFSAVAHYKLIERLKKETGLKVVLSGQGGDEILMGYLKFFFFNVKNLISKGCVAQALKEVFLSFVKKTAVWQFNFGEAKRYIPFVAGKGDKSFLRIKGTLEPIHECSDLRNRQRMDIDRYSVPNLTHYEDRNAMAHSTEIRLPFLDYRLVNFLTNIPIHMKLNGGWSKYILRSALSELPEEIRWRKDKQGFITPESIWLKKNFNNLIREVFNGSSLSKMGIIDDKEFFKYYDRFLKGDRSIWYIGISRVLIAELWARKFFGNDMEAEIIKNEYMACTNR